MFVSKRKNVISSQLKTHMKDTWNLKPIIPIKLKYIFWQNDMGEVKCFLASLLNI